MNFTLFFSLYLLIFLINIIAFNCFYTENESIEKLKKDEKNENLTLNKMFYSLSKLHSTDVNVDLNFALIKRNSNTEKNQTSLKSKNFKLIAESSENCISESKIKKCDAKLADDFFIGIDFVYHEKDCEKVSEYQKCIDVISESCREDIKQEIKSILYSRVIGVENICRFKKMNDISMIGKRIDFREELKSTLDLILERECRSVAKPLIFVCIEQVQTRVNSFFDNFNHDFQDLGSNSQGLFLCCAMLEYSECIKVITNVKCGYKVSNHVYAMVENLRKNSSAHICNDMSYESQTCQMILYSFSNVQSWSVFSLLFIFIVNLYKSTFY